MSYNRAEWREISCVTTGRSEGKSHELRQGGVKGNLMSYNRAE